MRINGSIIGSVVTSSALSATGIWGLQNVELANRLNVWPAQIVTSGSVLFLDASNTNSYSGSGTTWYDLSGNGNTGTLTNGPTFSGVNGGSIVFDGVDDYVNIPYNASTINFPTNNATVCVWYKVSTVGDGIGVLVTQRSSTGTGIQIYADATKLYADGGSTAGLYSTTIIPNGTIAFGGIVFDKTNSLLKLYINGIYDSQVSYTGNIQDTYPIRLGTGAFGDGPFPGNIYTVNVYNRSLTATEILQNFNATRTRFGV